jgi:hypothetical protein
MASRKLTTAEQAAMIWLSGGSCYWPGCGVPAIMPVTGKYRMNVEVAHIRAFDDNGPRSNVNMTHEEREAWTNKVLLCHPHHTEVDAEPETYSADKLEEWKSGREADAHGQLSALRVSESQLQELITEVLAEQNERVNQTLERLEKSDAEAAAVMRELRDQLDVVRQHGGLLDIDAVGMLDSAAYKVEHLQDSASTLYEAANKLGNFSDNANTLSEAAEKLTNLGDSANALAQAADQLPGMWDLIPALQAVVNDLKRYGGNM